MIRYSLEGLLINKLKILKDPVLFSKAFIDEFGNIAWDVDDKKDSNLDWDNRIDISKDIIYIEGEKVK